MSRSSVCLMAVRLPVHSIEKAFAEENGQSRFEYNHAKESVNQSDSNQKSADPTFHALFPPVILAANVSMSSHMI